MVFMLLSLKVKDAVSTICNPSSKNLTVQAIFNDKLHALKEEEYCFIACLMQKPAVTLPQLEAQFRSL